MSQFWQYLTSPIVRVVILLVCSNVFMTFAWYGHLKNWSSKPIIFVVVMSWGIAFFEYLLQVPANRIGHNCLELSQLKILQEVISLSVFSLYALFYAKEHLSWNYVWAGLCILGAVFFIFRR